MTKPDHDCRYCEEEVTPEEKPDIPDWIHRECLVRAVVGSIGHQLKQCTCYGGTLEDPPDMTKREAARFAYDHFMREKLIPSVAIKIIKLWGGGEPQANPHQSGHD